MFDIPTSQSQSYVGPGVAGSDFAGAAASTSTTASTPASTPATPALPTVPEPPPPPPLFGASSPQGKKPGRKAGSFIGSATAGAPPPANLGYNTLLGQA